MNRDKIEAMFDKFDTDQSQKLEFDELKGYLTELNGGHAPKVPTHKQRRTTVPTDIFFTSCRRIRIKSR